jgi:hypothetical protein
MAAIYELMRLWTTVFAFSGVSQEPKVDVIPIVEHGHIVFDIPRSHVNNLMRVRVEDEAGKPLWVVDFPGGQRSRKITYGIVPTARNQPARQEVPFGNQLPPPIRGKTVHISVQYQYDTFMAACSSEYTKKIGIPK